MVIHQLIHHQWSPAPHCTIPHQSRKQVIEIIPLPIKLRDWPNLVIWLTLPNIHRSQSHITDNCLWLSSLHLKAKALNVPMNHYRFTPTFQFSLSPTPLCHKICSKSLQHHQCNSRQFPQRIKLKQQLSEHTHVSKLHGFAFWVILDVYNAQY